MPTLPTEILFQLLICKSVIYHFTLWRNFPSLYIYSQAEADVHVFFVKKRSMHIKNLEKPWSSKQFSLTIMEEKKEEPQSACFCMNYTFIDKPTERFANDINN